MTQELLTRLGGAVDHETAWKWRKEVWLPEQEAGDAS
jgi:hypothetical protein